MRSTPRIGLLTSVLIISLIFCACHSQNHKPIGIATLGKFNAMHLDSIQAALERVYGIPVVHIYDSALPQHTFINVKSPRYRADKLIRHLKNTKPDSIRYLLGLTAKDISTTKRDALGKIKKPKSKYEDYGIFGLGFRPGVSCIVSSYRLGRGGNPKMKVERLQKVSIHEIGHNMGLKHCPNKKCVMTSAVEKLSTVDNAKMKLCKACTQQLN